MIRISCHCYFDITETGITGNYRSFRNAATTVDESAWARSRNQQRNWETITQIISLRTQAFELSTPVCIDGIWNFNFGVETPDVFGTADDPLALLVNDCIDVPMILGLSETKVKTPLLIVAGQDQNIWFKLVNNTL